MDKRKIGYGAAIGAGLVIAGIALCPRNKGEKTEAPVVTPYTENIIQPIPQPNIYTVQKGDYLSKIVYNELGVRGKAIYDECLRIQEANNLGSERDISMVVNGELVPGKDGFVDLIYPGENLNLD